MWNHKWITAPSNVRLLLPAVPVWAFIRLHFSVLLKHRASFYHYSCLPLHAEAWIRYWGERLLDEKVSERDMVLRVGLASSCSISQGLGSNWVLCKKIQSGIGRIREGCGIPSCPMCVSTALEGSEL